MTNSKPLMILSSAILWVMTVYLCVGTSRDVSQASLSGKHTVDPQLRSFTPSASVTGDPLHLAANLETLHLTEDLAEAVQTSQPGWWAELHSVGVAQTPRWWQISQGQTVALLTEPMRDTETTRYQHALGYAPLRLRVAMAPVAMVVHPTNPVANRYLTLRELDAIFSTTRVRGHHRVQRWGDLGINDVWAQHPITPHGHDVSASLFGYFRQHVLQHGTFKDDVQRHPSSAAVVQAVHRDPHAIGYVSLSFVTPAVRVVPLKADADTTALMPTSDTVLSLHYPLSHTLYLYVKLAPGQRIKMPLLAWLRFIYSRQGQQLLADKGYVPLSMPVVRQELQKLGMSIEPQEP